MDESWRMRMGMPSTTITGSKHKPSGRRSTEDTSYRQTSENPLLDPEDFNDVFGGPPRTVMSRQFSGNNEYFPRSSSTSFYEEIFRPPENLTPEPAPARSGRNLPEFRIPAEKGARRSNQFEGFYGDIFGWKEEDLKRSRSRTRSRSKSKTSSSSVLSSEDLSPLRPAIGGGEMGADQDVSLFASRLRPINVPRRWTSSRAMQEEHPEQLSVPPFSSNCHLYDVEYNYNENFRGSHFRFCKRNPSPETISLEQNSYGSVKVSTDELELHNSPSSVISSLCQDQEAAAVVSRTQDEMSQEQATEQDEDEVMSSYVIEINADSREWTEEAVGVDEAIAWAKEKFQTHCSGDMVGADQISDGHKDGNESTHAAGDEEPETWINTEQKQQLEETDMEMELLNEKIRLWSTGKEADIRLLLSTLHHILWPDSGWLAVPLTNLIESSHVKKAYQKARLFLHPDKLQQRGATFPQKYVAEKAFPIIQDAWASFVSQDVFCR